MNTTKTIILFTALAAIVTATYFGFGSASKENTAVAQDSKWKTNPPVDLSTDKGKLGYTFGAQMASQLVGSGLLEEIDLEAFYAAFRDLTSGSEAQLTTEEMQATQIAFQERQQAKAAAVAAENKAKGEAFLVKNAKEDGIVTTESGLQYKVVREGKGKQPKAEDTVKVHYLGSLTDGTPFDSSYTRGAPADFPVSGVIPGFSEGIQLMKEGSEYLFVIPSELAYGAGGPPNIGPDQVLVFKVELLEVL